MSITSEENNNDEQNTASQRRIQIIREATSLFRAKGFAATSMNDVARVVGVSKPAIYHYFKNKKELFVAVSTDGPEKSVAKMKALVADTSMTSMEKLSQMLDAAYEGIVNSPCGEMMPLVAETSTRFPDIARYFRDGFIAEMHDAAQAIVKEGLVRGEFKNPQTDFFSDLVFSPPVMMALSRSMFGNLEDSPPYLVEIAKDDHLKSLIAVLT
ncbi:TetR/AcrR family transcriptional regulator [Parasulfitobacter algicola]|uniref:TetR/AcrR family transcriptional regulator n=1 Tax=Parasulfitobacter algicola TaxID=2614809 RepID=A0ABX2IVE0_9RHOB|nr:TetR/AcrR family transcriptional regulator [Sulfitobacter algicola]NSX54339.1 TetR/AcrR family transcriptional regulator [Sulfitobacter algicola]